LKNAAIKDGDDATIEVPKSIGLNTMLIGLGCTFAYTSSPLSHGVMT
jgi:hypothetical protein